MGSELISVIVPVFNVQDYLDLCLNSILSQTYKELEIILVDDGSTDDSGRICDKYAGKDKRIKVIHQGNQGLSAARNKGIALSSGLYIAFIDSDDFIENKFIQVMYDIMQKSGSDIVCCEFFCFMDGKEKDVINHWNKSTGFETGYEVYDSMNMLEMALYQHISVTGAQQKLYRKWLFDDIMFPEGRYFEDLATTYLFFLKVNRIAVAERSLYAYRIRNNGIMNERFQKRKLDCVWVAERLFQDIKRYTPQLEKAAACAAFRVNRLVFHQIPVDEKHARNQVWEEIHKYRKTVVLDKKAQRYERLLALMSYGGKSFFVLNLVLFKLLRECKIRYGIKR